MSLTPEKIKAVYPNIQPLTLDIVEIARRHLARIRYLTDSNKRLREAGNERCYNCEKSAEDQQNRIEAESKPGGL